MSDIETTPEAPPAPQPEAVSTPEQRNGHMPELEGAPASPLGLPAAPVHLTREDIELLKGTIARDAFMTDAEFTMFLRMCESWGLNPLLREIWAIRYKQGEPLSIFASRDGLLSAARRDPGYMGAPVSFAVRESDEFAIDVDGDEVRVTHRMGKPPRGALLGAWAKVSRARCTPVVFFAPIEEFRRPTRPWQTNPESMCLAAAERGALKRQFGLSGLQVEGDEFDAPEIGASPALPALPAPNPPSPEQIARCTEALRRLGHTEAQIMTKLRAVTTADAADTLLLMAEVAAPPEPPAARPAPRNDEARRPARPAAPAPAGPPPNQPPARARQARLTDPDMLGGGPQSEPGERG